MTTEWRFPIMIATSLLVFFGLIRLVASKRGFREKRKKIILLGLIIVVFGMFFGKYGASFGLPLWIYYPVMMY